MIAYMETAEGTSPAQLQGFFVGWPNPPSPETHLRLLLNSAHAVLAVDDQTSMVVGFVTAITDGVLSAYIPLLEVLPSYQRQGIGRELMRRMLQRLSGLYMVDLLCEQDFQPFYSTLGMRAAAGMALRNYAHQSGSPEPSADTMGPLT